MSATGWRRIGGLRLTGAPTVGAAGRAWSGADVVAGVTVAAYLIPQVMAYASLAGLSPVAGLWATLPALAAYAVLGTSRHLAVGPESTTALMTAATVGPIAAGDASRYAALAAALAVILGVYCLVAWAVRLGFVADLLSRPVLVGYLAGLAVVMVISQLGHVTGVSLSGSSPSAQLWSFLTQLNEINGPTVAVSAGTVMLASLQLRYPRLPGPLIAVVGAAAAVSMFGLGEHGVTLLGHVSFALPAPAMPAASDVGRLMLPALGLLLVAYADMILTGRAFASRHGYAVEPNRELLALSAANVGAGLVRGFPVSSSASRTALAEASGARTKAYSVVTAACVVVAVLFLGSFLDHVPVCALGALVIYAGSRLVDVGEFRRLARFRRRELLLAVATAAGVLAVNILYGVLIAVALSVAEMLSRVARPHDAILGLVPGLAGMHDIDDYPEAAEVPGLLVYRYDSPLFFANAEDFKRRALAAADSHGPTLAWFVLNVEANVEVDITALDALESLREELAARGVVVALARVKQDLLAALNAYGLSASIGSDHLFPTLPTAVAAYRAATGR